MNINDLTPEMREKLIKFLQNKKQPVVSKKKVMKEVSIEDTYTCTLCGHSYHTTYTAIVNNLQRPRTYHITHCDKCIEYLMNMNKLEAITTVLDHFTKRHIKEV